MISLANHDAQPDPASLFQIRMTTDLVFNTALRQRSGCFAKFKPNV